MHISGDSPNGDQKEIRKETSITGQPKITNVNSDVPQSVESGGLSCIASGKIIDPTLCFYLTISKMHMFEAKWNHYKILPSK